MFAQNLNIDNNNGKIKKIKRFLSFKEILNAEPNYCKGTKFTNFFP